MDETHLYLFVDYDGVVITHAEGFPYGLHDSNVPFSHSMIKILSYVAFSTGLPAYFIPMSSSPGNFSKAELKQLFVDEYKVKNLDLHPEEPIEAVRKDRHLFVKRCVEQYHAKYYIVLDDEYFWYENQNLNYFQTHTYDGIRHEVFLEMCHLAEQFAKQIKEAAY